MLKSVEKSDRMQEGINRFQELSIDRWLEIDADLLKVRRMSRHDFYARLWNLEVACNEFANRRIGFATLGRRCDFNLPRPILEFTCDLIA